MNWISVAMAGVGSSTISLVKMRERTHQENRRIAAKFIRPTTVRVVLPNGPSVNTRRLLWKKVDLYTTLMRITMSYHTGGSQQSSFSDPIFADDE